MRSAKVPFIASWRGSSGRAGPTGSSVSSDADWAALWSRLDPGSPPPAADFSRSTALAVFGARGQRSVSVVSVVDAGDRLVVRYRATPGSGGSAAPYSIGLVPKTDVR